jgi:hypothetical protein
MNDVLAQKTLQDHWMRGMKKKKQNKMEQTMKYQFERYLDKCWPEGQRIRVSRNWKDLEKLQIRHQSQIWKFE